ncbi:tetratricopeptide repeat protein, partial [Candidatus Sumerlaeota bacterium]|nr:tetratricopeptide repeat protein [Candidatus Sumerlaeota bacterium]
LESCEQCRRMIEGWQLICESLKLEHQRIIESIPEEKLTLIYTRAKEKAGHSRISLVPTILLSLREWLRVWWESPRISWQAIRVATILIFGFLIGIVAVRNRGELPKSAMLPAERTVVSEKPVVQTTEDTAGESAIEKALKKYPQPESSPVKIDKNAYPETAGVPRKKPPLAIVVGPTVQPVKPVAESVPTSRESEIPNRIPYKSDQEHQIRLVAKEFRGSINNLQQIKLQLMRTGKAESIAYIHNLEGSILRIISLEENPKDSGWNSLSNYQQAESALLKNDYVTALQKYYSVIADSPNSYLSFLAHYQIGNIQLQYLNNYSEALSEFQLCLQNYPESYFTPEQRRAVLENIALLSENAIDNWRPLRLYLEAKKSSVDVGLVLYQELLEDYPQLSLARKSVQHLLQSVLSSQYEDSTVPNRVIGMFQEAMNKIKDTQLRQQLQMGIADIMNYRLFNRRQALLEYSRAIQIDPHSAMAMAARQRIREIYDATSTHPYR